MFRCHYTAPKRTSTRFQAKVSTQLNIVLIDIMVVIQYVSVYDIIDQAVCLNRFPSFWVGNSIIKTKTINAPIYGEVVNNMGIANKI